MQRSLTLLMKGSTKNLLLQLQRRNITEGPFDGIFTCGNLTFKADVTVRGQNSKKEFTVQVEGLPHFIPTNGTVTAERTGDDKHGQLNATSVAAGPMKISGPLPPVSYTQQSDGTYHIKASADVRKIIEQQPFYLTRAALRTALNTLGISNTTEVTGRLTKK